MDWQDFSRNVLSALANVFHDARSAEALLEDIGFPAGRIPTFTTGNAEQYWRQAAREVANGAVPGGLDGLVAAAAERYPHHPVFRRHAPAAPDHDRRDSGASIVISGEAELRRVLERARAISAEQGLDGQVEVGFVTPDNIQLRFPTATPEQAAAVAGRLREEQLAERTTVVPNDFRDYLLQRLFVEGPDQGRFELSDIPASTRTKDIVQAVMSQYHEGIWPRDRDGQARNAVIDQVDEGTGAHTRLDPQSSLHESGVEDGATLHVAPESTAGAINPIIREEALARVRAQVLAYARAHPGFRVQANAKVAPTEYLLSFEAPGWGPPSDDGAPYPVDRHKVLLLLPTNFPMQAPTAFWQSPIFHPNVHPKNGKVCLGALEDRYRPGLHFGELCQILVDIASYRNYEIREGYDRQARDWAVSKAGQAAIERRGGTSITRLLLSMIDDRTRAPLPLRIKRCDP